MPKRAGGCLCGAVRYECEGKPQFSLQCHCRDCQRQSGAPHVAAVRAQTSSGEVGVSAWNGIAVARLCARDGATLRRDLGRILAALDRGPLPKLWLT